jgi:hypothetical protein
MDDIGLTLKSADMIEAWQARDRKKRPWVWNRQVKSQAG